MFQRLRGDLIFILIILGLDMWRHWRHYSTTVFLPFTETGYLIPNHAWSESFYADFPIGRNTYLSHLHLSERTVQVSCLFPCHEGRNSKSSRFCWTFCNG